MRLQFGDSPRTENASPEPPGWQVIRSPGKRLSYWLATLMGLALPTGLCVALSLWSWAIGDRGEMATAEGSATSWGIIAVVLVVYIPLHELVHLIGQPEWGRSNQSVMVIWPARLRFGVYYEGCMSRRRWLAMRLAPLIVLSVLPTAVLALLQIWPSSVNLEVGLQVLMLVNALGSGGDMIAALLVVSQVPPAGCLCFQEGKAYWRPVHSDAEPT